MIDCIDCGRSYPGHMLNEMRCDDCSDRELAAECVRLKDKLMRRGLYKTGHAMEDVVTSIGWELAAHAADSEASDE